MAARVSATGITHHVYDTEPYNDTSRNDESAKILGSTNDGVKAEPLNYKRPAQAGSKAPGGTRTKGGAI